MNKVIKTTDQQMPAQLQEALHILHNLRFFTKYWNETGGGQARDYKKRWEEKADKLLNSYGLTIHQNTRYITVIKSQL